MAAFTIFYGAFMINEISLKSNFYARLSMISSDWLIDVYANFHILSFRWFIFALFRIPPSMCLNTLLNANHTKIIRGFKSDNIIFN